MDISRAMTIPYSAVQRVVGRWEFVCEIAAVTCAYAAAVHASIYIMGWLRKLWDGYEDSGMVMKTMAHWFSSTGPLAPGQKCQSFVSANKLTGQGLAQQNNVKPRPLTSSSFNAGCVNP